MPHDVINVKVIIKATSNLVDLLNVILSLRVMSVQRRPATAGSA